MSKFLLEFESPLKDIENKIQSLKSTSYKTGIDVADTIKKLEKELLTRQNEIYNNLSRWDRVQIARHPKRPYTKDFIDLINNFWLEIHGDRKYADDKSIICGLAKLNEFKRPELPK